MNHDLNFNFLASSAPNLRKNWSGLCYHLRIFSIQKNWHLIYFRSSRVLSMLSTMFRSRQWRHFIAQGKICPFLRNERCFWPHSSQLEKVWERPLRSNAWAGSKACPRIFGWFWTIMGCLPLVSRLTKAAFFPLHPIKTTILLSRLISHTTYTKCYRSLH